MYVCVAVNFRGQALLVPCLLYFIFNYVHMSVGAFQRLEAVVSLWIWVLGIKLRPSGRAVHSDLRTSLCLTAVLTALRIG